MSGVIKWLVQPVEIAGAGLVMGGVAIALFRIVRVPFMRQRPPLAALQIRLGLGMFLALGLEFQLAADILRTAVSPTFTEIAQLGAIAGIRTALNFFLGREFVEGQRQIDAITAAHLDTRASGPPASPLFRAPPLGPSEPSAASGADPPAEPDEARRRPLRATLRDALKGPFWIPELPRDAAQREAVAERGSTAIGRQG